MWITANGNDSIEIENDVVKRVLGMYPEEQLAEDRPVFREAFESGRITFDDLKAESDKILIPWQMFLLSPANLDTQLAHIEEQRKFKVSEKLVAKRKGTGDITSRRIVDRLIRQQNFLVSSRRFGTNPFCGSLVGLSTAQAVEFILRYFSIERAGMWRYVGKGKALEYLIQQVEEKNINIARGVLANKILPMTGGVLREVYRNTSGFVIKDEKVPYLFLPSEINQDEVESRQIYTLIYLLAIVGLGQYSYFIGKNFKTQILKATGTEARLHAITSELLVPGSEVETFRGRGMTTEMRDELSQRFKVSPSALVTTLRKRGILSKQQYEDLRPPPFVPKKREGKMRTPWVSTSVAKFCGQISHEAIKGGIQGGALSSIQAQYLIWGSVNKVKYRKYRNELHI
jgi:Zn-dependent peptidase ImmA (M78 family)